jgi:hypothetical protein
VTLTIRVLLRVAAPQAAPLTKIEFVPLLA